MPKKIKALINDIFDMITKANYDEYYIDMDGKIISQIIENIAKYSENKTYLDIIEILEHFDIENEFKDLVKIRNDKFRLNYDDFKSKEKAIVSQIINKASNNKEINFFLIK